MRKNILYKILSLLILTVFTLQQASFASTPYKFSYDTLATNVGFDAIETDSDLEPREAIAQFLRSARDSLVGSGTSGPQLETQLRAQAQLWAAQYRRMNLPVTVTSPDEFGRVTARTIADEIRELQQDPTREVVIVLATGDTMVEFLHNLAEEQGIDWNRVQAFHLDEWEGLAPDHSDSLAHYLHEHFFSRVPIPLENIHYINGADPDPEAYMAEVRAHGRADSGADITLLGVGPNGHLGLNEPPDHSSFDSRMRSVPVAPETIAAQQQRHPVLATMRDPHGITMGMADIFEGNHLYCLARGEHKAGIMQQVIEGDVTETVPASRLQIHENATFIVDSDAANQLQGPHRGGYVDFAELASLVDETVQAVLQEGSTGAIKLARDGQPEEFITFEQDKGPIRNVIAERLADPETSGAYAVAVNGQNIGRVTLNEHAAAVFQLIVQSPAFGEALIAARQAAGKPAAYVTSILDANIIVVPGLEAGCEAAGVSGIISHEGHGLVGEPTGRSIYIDADRFRQIMEHGSAEERIEFIVHLITHLDNPMEGGEDAAGYEARIDRLAPTRHVRSFFARVDADDDTAGLDPRPTQNRLLRPEWVQYFMTMNRRFCQRARSDERKVMFCPASAASVVEFLLTNADVAIYADNNFRGDVGRVPDYLSRDLSQGSPYQTAYYHRGQIRTRMVREDYDEELLEQLIIGLRCIGAEHITVECPDDEPHLTKVRFDWAYFGEESRERIIYLTHSKTDHDAAQQQKDFNAANLDSYPEEVRAVMADGIDYAVFKACADLTHSQESAALRAHVIEVLNPDGTILTEGSPERNIWAHLPEETAQAFALYPKQDDSEIVTCEETIRDMLGGFMPDGAAGQIIAGVWGYSEEGVEAWRKRVPPVHPAVYTDAELLLVEANAIQFRQEHVARVTETVTLLANRWNELHPHQQLTPEDIRLLRTAALTHDYGYNYTTATAMLDTARMNRKYGITVRGSTFPGVLLQWQNHPEVRELFNESNVQAMRVWFRHPELSCEFLDENADVLGVANTPELKLLILHHWNSAPASFSPGRSERLILMAQLLHCADIIEASNNRKGGLITGELSLAKTAGDLRANCDQQQISPEIRDLAMDLLTHPEQCPRLRSVILRARAETGESPAEGYPQADNAFIAREQLIQGALAMGERLNACFAVAEELSGAAASPAAVTARQDQLTAMIEGAVVAPQPREFVASEHEPLSGVDLTAFGPGGVIVVGANGYIGSEHLAALPATLAQCQGDIRLVGGIDLHLLSKPTITMFQESNPGLSLQFFPRPESALAYAQSEHDLDPSHVIALLATPDDVHFQNIRELAALGVTKFIVEKPIADTSTELNEILAFAHEHGLTIVGAGQVFTSRLVDTIRAVMDEHGFQPAQCLVYCTKDRTQRSVDGENMDNPHNFSYELFHELGTLEQLVGEATGIDYAYARDMEVPEGPVFADHGLGVAVARHTSGARSICYSNFTEPGQHYSNQKTIVLTDQEGNTIIADISVDNQCAETVIYVSRTGEVREYPVAENKATMLARAQARYLEAAVTGTGVATTQPAFHHRMEERMEQAIALAATGPALYDGGINVEQELQRGDIDVVVDEGIQRAQRTDRPDDYPQYMKGLETVIETRTGDLRLNAAIAMARITSSHPQTALLLAGEDPNTVRLADTLRDQPVLDITTGRIGLVVSARFILETIGVREVLQRLATSDIQFSVVADATSEAEQRAVEALGLPCVESVVAQDTDVRGEQRMNELMQRLRRAGVSLSQNVGVIADPAMAHTEAEEIADALGVYIGILQAPAAGELLSAHGAFSSVIEAVANPNPAQPHVFDIELPAIKAPSDDLQQRFQEYREAIEFLKKA
jgi:glucosamine-6-phosphate deaminase